MNQSSPDPTVKHFDDMYAEICYIDKLLDENLVA